MAHHVSDAPLVSSTLMAHLHMVRHCYIVVADHMSGAPLVSIASIALFLVVRARRDDARRRVLARSPRWHGQSDAQKRPNLVYALDRAVLSVGEVMVHAQADQT